MKMAYLSHSAIPSRDANAVHVMKMCQAFARQGHEVTLYARPGAEPAQDDYAYYGVEPHFRIVKVRRPPLKRLGNAFYGCAVARTVSAHRPLPDLFYARDSFSLAACAHFGRPMVLESHAPPGAMLGRRLQTWLLRQDNFCQLVVVSQALHRMYRRLFPWCALHKILVVPVGADLTLPADQPGTNGGWRGRSGCLQVGYAGHLYPGKGVEIIVALAKRLTDVEFHVVGGTNVDVERWRAETAGVVNVHFYGHVPPSRTSAFRQAMDVLLAPYQRRPPGAGHGPGVNLSTCPLKVFEYMASRKPIIASRLPAVREILSHEQTALLVPPQDVEAWAQAIRRLQQGNGLRAKLAEAAFAQAASELTWEARATRVLDGVGQ